MYREILKSKALLTDSNKKKRHLFLWLKLIGWQDARVRGGVEGRHEVSDRVDYLFPDELPTKPQFDARNYNFGNSGLFSSRRRTDEQAGICSEGPSPNVHFCCPSPPPNLPPELFVFSSSERRLSRSSFGVIAQ